MFGFSKSIFMRFLVQNTSGSPGQLYRGLWIILAIFRITWVFRQNSWFLELLDIFRISTKMAKRLLNTQSRYRRSHKSPFLKFFLEIPRKAFRKFWKNFGNPNPENPDVYLCPKTKSENFFKPESEPDFFPIPSNPWFVSEKSYSLNDNIRV